VFMITKRWVKRSFPPRDFHEEIGLPYFHSHLLYNRGIRDLISLKAFRSSKRNSCYDPSLLPNMGKGVIRILSAIRSKENIAIFGDFDTDGITGTALLIRALTDLGIRVIPYIPDRVDEGHGLNREAIQLLYTQGVSLIITVDCGATSVEEVELASDLGIDTIVTDHHVMTDEAPRAHAIINPNHPKSKYPYIYLTGVGMSFKLVEALYQELNKPWPEHLLDLVALGTVADVGPLTGENRFLVRKGLQQLNKTKNPGILALASVAKQKIGTLDTESLSFGLIPRLNVAGRLGHASTSLSLLTSSKPGEARMLALKLDDQNRQRQAITHEGVTEALSQIENVDDNRLLPSIIIVKSTSWIPGILGLIASQMSERFYRPAIAINLGEKISRGSARSIPEFNMVEAIEDCADILIKSGGHHQAAGFTLATSSVSHLEKRLLKWSAGKLQHMDLSPTVNIDCEVPFSIFTQENVNFIQSLAPFGEKNEPPSFLTREVKVLDLKSVGAGGQHLKLQLWNNGKTFDGIAFRQGHLARLINSNPIDIVYSIGINTWGYRPTLQLTVHDVRV